ncbi:autophagy-related protein 2 homolog A-like isoform X2 [Apostichopus japonicus]|uniref:autophagy-related protein 2 homolog A-like isoform X2 n=1 Tax=Stichopus japonicus TaxID=307972 RepID=UPI003AB5DA0A
MPWHFPWPEYIKKKACRYILQHYVGNFLEEKLTLDQLSVDLYSGTGTVTDVKLDVWAINENLNVAGAPVELRGGNVGSISVSVPWSMLLTENSKVEIKGLELILQPKYRENEEDFGGLAESMWNSVSMTSSMMLAQDCLKQEPSVGEQRAVESQPFEGPELLAQTIDSVLTRIQVTLRDTVIRFEHVPENATRGVALEMQIEVLQYYDELSQETPRTDGSSVDTGQRLFEPAPFIKKHFQMMGVSLHFEEFPEESRSQNDFSPGGYQDLSMNSPPVHILRNFHGSPSSPEMPPPHSGIPSSHPNSSDQSKGYLTLSLVGEFAGKMELTVKIKQNDQVPGAKAEVDLMTGSMNLFFSPKQVHLLMELVQGYLSPAISNDNSAAGMQRNKPMVHEDFERIEGTLQQEMILRGTEMYPTDRMRDPGVLSDDDIEPLAQSCEDDIFYSMSRGRASSSSSSYRLTNDMESSYTSTMSTASVDTNQTGTSTLSTLSTVPLGYSQSYSKDYTSRPHRHSKHRKAPGLEQLVEEVTRYKFQCRSLSITLLHNDPTKTSLFSQSLAGGREALPRGSQEEGDILKQRAEDFFQNIGKLGFGQNDNKNSWRDRFTKACPFDHIRLICAPIKLQCVRRSGSKHVDSDFDLSINTAVVEECLMHRERSSRESRHTQCDECIEILTFDNKNKPKGTEEPCIKVIWNLHAQGGQHRRKKLESTVNINIGPLSSEIDISLVDRLYCLLHPQQVYAFDINSGQNIYKSFHSIHGKMSRQAVFNQALDEGPQGPEHKISVCMTCPLAHFPFRFPVPDLRDLSDIAWFTRSVRPEILHTFFEDLEVKTVLGDSKSNQQELIIQAREINASMQMENSAPLIPFLKVVRGGEDNNDKKIDWPRLVVSINPIPEQNILERSNNHLGEPDSSFSRHPMEESIGESYCRQQENKEPSPFSAKRVGYMMEDQMVMPGDPDEMAEFIDTSTKSSRFSLQLTLPNVSVHLPSKDFLETIYNRFGNDLLLWTPSAPTPRDIINVCQSFGPVAGMDILSQFGSQPYFSVCQSSYGFTESDEDDDDLESIKRSCGRNKGSKELAAGQNFMSFSLVVGQGFLSAQMPIVKEDGVVDMDAHGEILILLEETNLFAVTAVKGDPGMSYLCAQAKTLDVFQNGVTANDSESPFMMHDPSQPIPEHLQLCLHLSEEGVTGKPSGRQKTQPMLALALKMEFKEDTNCKMMQCAVGLRGATMRVTLSQLHHHWIVQLGELFDLTDVEIKGYQIPKVITEFHAHLWGCGLDYRPVSLPLRSFLLLDSLSISSNLMYEAKISVQRFLVDNAFLFLSDKCNEQRVDLRKNYVCVLDVGNLEVNLRTNAEVKDDDRPNLSRNGRFPSKAGNNNGGGLDGKRVRKSPQFELRVRNDMIHIRTCADSCSALASLLIYLASDGDIRTSSSSSAPHAPPTINDADCELATELDTMVSKSPLGQGNHLDQMTMLMDEAMEELSPGGKTKQGSDGPFAVPCTLSESPNSRMFYFPNEDTGSSPVMETAMLDSHHDLIDQELRMIDVDEQSKTSQEDHFIDDDGFDILDDLGAGIGSRDGEPVVKVLAPNIKILDDHFSKPYGKGDQLKAPAHFPDALQMFTVQELTVIWHMYGGNDFGIPQKKADESPKELSSGMKEHTHSKQRMGSPGSDRKPKDQRDPQSMDWKERGGKGRDHKVLMEFQVNKLQFRHEVYPNHTTHAARQVLLINDIEVRDKLAASQINKFLYQYSSGKIPKRSNASMVSIRAVHIRPDAAVPTQECCLRVSLQPMRFNIDQDALFFVLDFFKEIYGLQIEGPTDNYPPSSAGGVTPPSVTSVPIQVPGSSTSPLKRPVDNYHSLDSKEPSSLSPVRKPIHKEGALAPIFFRSFVFSPDVPVKLDYEGKRLQMEQGTFVGILAGLGQLNKSEFSLRRLHNRQGLLGVDKLLQFAINEWMTDIQRNQFSSILGGVGPMHSFVEFFAGLFDIIRLPVEQYQRDGRIIRGFQRGANSLGTSTTMAAVELTNRMVRMLQSVAEMTYDLVTPGPGVARRSITAAPFVQPRLSRQPMDIREGMTNAFNLFKEGTYDTANAIYQTAWEEYQQKGVTGAVGGFIRQVPPSMIRPFILATEASSSILGGVRNQILPDARKEDDEKWRSEQG